ncbi:hypothetical protein ACFDTO_25530 [Microbacteriaceae bacterium 4G12]
MYPQFQPILYRSTPYGPVEDSRFLPFFGLPFLAGIAGGLLGGLFFGGRPCPYPVPYPYPMPYPFPVPYGQFSSPYAY